MRVAGWVAVAAVLVGAVGCGSTQGDGGAASVGTPDAGSGSGGGSGGGGGSDGGGGSGGGTDGGSGGGGGGGGPVQYILTLDVKGPGSGAIRGKALTSDCRASCKLTIDAGTLVSFEALPDNFNVFDGWSGACAGKGSCILTVNQDLAVSASFAVQPYTLTVVFRGNGGGRVTSSPPGLDCTSATASCSATFPAGTNVVLNTTPELLSKFGGWAGACGGSNCSVSMRSDQVAVAAFDLQRYAVLDLGTPPGGYFSQNLAISRNGRLMAGNWGGNPNHPFFWDGSMKALDFEGYAVGVDDGGVVGGIVVVNGHYHPFRWQAGVFKDLGGLGGLDSWPHSVGAQGTIIGSSLRADGQLRAVYWNDTGAVDLGSLGATWSGCSQAYGSNADGLIVGESCLSGYPWGTHAVRWRSPGVIDDYGTLGGTYGRAYAINDAGLIAGASSISNGDTHPIFIVDGKMIDAGVLTGTNSGELTAMNGAGIAVGSCWSSSVGIQRPVVATRNRMLDLNAQVDGTPYTIVTIGGIDEAGDIAATGNYQGQLRALILRPR